VTLQASCGYDCIFSVGALRFEVKQFLSFFLSFCASLFLYVCSSLPFWLSFLVIWFPCVIFSVLFFPFYLFSFSIFVKSALRFPIQCSFVNSCFLRMWNVFDLITLSFKVCGLYVAVCCALSWYRIGKIT